MIANTNRYPDNMQNMSADNYFRYKNPKSLLENEMIEIETNVMQVSKIQNQTENFEDNPNLENVIKKLENKAILPKPKIEEKIRTRKFKKPLNTHGARVERIEMVRGLNGNGEPIKK